MKDFSKALSPKLLNIEKKNRSNIFAWRGQFSPQLVECLLDAYCPPGSVVLDPFAGSGTVLYEAALMSLPAYGFEINPSAWSFSKIYEFSNIKRDRRASVLRELRRRIQHEFPIVIFSDDPLSADVVEDKVVRIGNSISDEAKILCNALVVLLDLYHNRITSDFVQSRFAALAELVERLPYSNQTIKADLQDARSLPLEDESVDFAITSPPYINVFNYHQNYRRSVEVLGWDLLRVARSEIGSNRANRGNRFYTVIQYCIDMTIALQELARVLKPEGRAVLIVGHESRVLGTPFYNADIIQRLATAPGLFRVALHQERVFTNRFGQAIREDVLNLVRGTPLRDATIPERVGRTIARDALVAANASVPQRNKVLLSDAIHRVSEIEGTPIFNGISYSEYYTRDYVMMVKED